MENVSEAAVAEYHRHVFKVVVVGNTAVGKTPLIKRYTDDVYEPRYIHTPCSGYIRTIGKYQ
jgi:GTPase SAR1 family protein